MSGVVWCGVVAALSERDITRQFRSHWSVCFSVRLRQCRSPGGGIHFVLLIPQVIKKNEEKKSISLLTLFSTLSLSWKQNTC